MYAGTANDFQGTVERQLTLTKMTRVRRSIRLLATDGKHCR
jgi:hypothetical protein